MSQINDNRLSELCSVKKARSLAPDALTENEFNTLIEMINRKYDNWVNEYRNGIKKWDYRVSTNLFISGEK